MKKKTKKKFYAIILSCLLGAASSVPVSAAGEAATMASAENSGIELYSSYIEPCWKCSGGSIYSDTRTISRNFEEAKLCQHGHTKGTDNYYTVTYAFVYSCNKCGYGWTETAKRTEIDCQGYD